jgi:eukaryotic-like serine/threonine-protein kinase
VLGDELGRGGMAVVYRARASPPPHRQVALKLLPLATRSEGVERFRREQAILARLDHPRIAALIDAGSADDGSLWLAMSLVEGQPIDQWCRSRRLELRARVVLLLQVCEALAYAHAALSSIATSSPRTCWWMPSGQVRLLDFGIAQALGEEDGLARAAFTPGFASPEQIRGEPATVRSDVFQLGRLLAVTLAGSEAERETLVLHGGEALTRWVEGNGAAAPPAIAPGGLPRDLRAILDRAQAADPNDRYVSVPAFAEDLRAFLAHRPVSARPRRPGYVALRWIQRHPFAAAATAGVVLLLAALQMDFSERLRAERDIAQRERDVAREQRDAAELARARAQAVLDFLNQDVLDAANPLRRAPGAPEVTVREALAGAEAQVEARLAGQPATLMAVLATLGNLRFEFGDYDAAESLYARALAQAGEVREADPVRLRLLADRGALQITRQDFVEGAATFEALLVLGRRSLGEDHPDTLEWTLRLLEAQSRQGADAAQRDAFLALAEHADRALGRPNRVAGEARLFVAHGYRAAGTPDAGADIAAQAREDLAASLGADHPTALKALAVLGHGLYSQGRDDEALAAMRQAYELQRARFGPDVLDSTFLQNEYGFMLVNAGRLREAVPVLADLVERRAAQGGPQSMGVIAPLSNLGNAHLRLGELDAALVALDRALAVFAAQPQPPPAMGAVLHRGRADVLREQRRFTDAERALDAGDTLAAALPAEDVRALALLGSRARLRHAQGDFAGGRAGLDAVITRLRAQVADDNPVLRPLLEARAAMDD